MDEEFEKLCAEIKEKASRGEDVHEEMRRLDEITKQKSEEVNEVIVKEAYKKIIYGLHQMGQEFIQKENHTMEEYNEILSWFDNTREKTNVEGHFYFEEIYFIINVNILTPLITIDNIDDIIIIYDKFMNKAIETVETIEEQEQLKRIYEEDRKNIRNSIEDRRRNYPTIREKITKKICQHCLRSINIDSQVCQYCGYQIEPNKDY